MSAPQISRTENSNDSAGSTGELIFCPNAATPLVLPSKVAIELMDQVNQGIRAVPRGGAEIGGLLIAARNGSGAVKIEALVPLKIEYSFGPSFRFSSGDLATLAGAVRTAQANPSKSVVGFYRSWTRGEVKLRASDQEILEGLRTAHSAYESEFRFVMILSQVSKLVLSAEVALRNGDAWTDWHSGILRMPGLVTEVTVSKPAPEPLPKSEPVPQPPAEKLQAAGWPAPLFPVSPPPRSQPPVLPPNGSVPRVPAPEPTANAPDYLRSRSIPQAVTYAALALLVVIAAAGAYYGLKARPSVSPPPSVAAVTPIPKARIGFAANPEGAMWKLTWDRDAVASLHPRGAVLNIRDGGKEQEVTLEDADLSTGMVFYTPQSGNLLFGLTLLVDGASPLQENVRVLRASPAVPPPAATTVQIPTSDHQLRTLRAFVPARPNDSNAAAKASPTADLPNAPVLESASNRPPVVSIPGSVLPPAIPPGRAPVPARAPVEANLTSPIATPAVAPPPPVQQVATPGYVPPRAIRQVRASRPIGTPLSEMERVEIKVEIDPMGKVRKITPLNRTATNHALVDAAMYAAHQWLFEPARSGGSPVSSELLINFEFGQK